MESVPKMYIEKLYVSDGRHQGRRVLEWYGRGAVVSGGITVILGSAGYRHSFSVLYR